MSIFAGTNGYLDGIAVNQVTEYEAEMLAFMRENHADVLAAIRDSKAFGDDEKAKTVAALDAFAKQFA